MTFVLLCEIIKGTLGNAPFVISEDECDAHDECPFPELSAFLYC